jgi:hypothetical protein
MVLIGFVIPSTEPTGDDFLNGTNDFALGCRATDTNFQIVYNDGAGSTNYTSTGITKDTGIHTFVLKIELAFNRVGFSHNGIAFTWIKALNLTTFNVGHTQFFI